MELLSAWRQQKGLSVPTKLKEKAGTHVHIFIFKSFQNSHELAFCKIIVENEIGHDVRPYNVQYLRRDDSYNGEKHISSVLGKAIP